MRKKLIYMFALLLMALMGTRAQSLDDIKLDMEPAGAPFTDPISGFLFIPVDITGVEVPNQGQLTKTSVVVEANVQVGNNVFFVKGIKSYAFKTTEESKVVITKVVLPETDGPLEIEEGAMKPNGTAVEVSVPLELLDDYALMGSLKENFEAGMVYAEVMSPNKLWTLSCGVDVVLPEGLTACKVRMDGSVPRKEPLSVAELTLAGGKRGVKAGNGVLLECADGAGTAFVLVANSGSQASGSSPVITDAKSYEGNALEPVVEAKHYEADGCLVLKDNKFHTIGDDASEVKACKAVLRVK